MPKKIYLLCMPNDVSSIMNLKPKRIFRTDASQTHSKPLSLNILNKTIVFNKYKKQVIYYDSQQQFVLLRTFSLLKE